MVKQIIIKNPNKNVIDIIKQEISDKKEKHKKLMESINPAIVDTLKKKKRVKA